MEDKEQFTKEQLEAISIIDKLYSLDKDIDLALRIFKEKTKENKVNLCSLKKSKVHFYSSIPYLFISLVEAIERGDLIFNEDIIRKEQVITQDGLIITNK
jgi:hypothetical protein